ncbi:MAG: hypothetical protein ACXADY_18340 [Candidatus Hodarchaeales archaeon]|jgi:hypothetical protein
MIVRDGMVAVQHYTTNGWTVKVNDTVYTWMPKHNVSLAWVKEEDLSKILSIGTRGCCGGKRKRFHLASLINVNLWETGNRHGTKEN